MNHTSIKDLEKYYGFKRKSDIQKGQVSEEYYIKWLNTKEQKYLDEIGDYNKEDCLSTAELLQWFLEIRDKNLPWFEPKVKEINLRPREEKMQIYEKKLKEADLESKDLQKIVYDILGFYYRENKPEYRRYFSRKLKDHEELVDVFKIINVICLSTSTYLLPSEYKNPYDCGYYDKSSKKSLLRKILNQ